MIGDFVLCLTDRLNKEGLIIQKIIHKTRETSWNEDFEIIFRIPIKPHVIYIALESNAVNFLEKDYTSKRVVNAILHKFFRG